MAPKTMYVLQNSQWKITIIYLYELIPKPNNPFNNRTQSNIPSIFCRTESFKNSFFPNSIIEWLKLGNTIQNSVSVNHFKSKLLKIIRPIQNSIFDVTNEEGIKLLTCLRLGLSHLNKHKFTHGFLDTLNPMCSCNTEEESVSHFFLRCPNFTHIRNGLMNEITNIDLNISFLNDDNITNILLYGDKKFSSELNSKIINLTINFILSSKRFDEAWFQ